MVLHIQISFNSIKIFLNEPILTRSASHIQQVLRTFSLQKPYRDLCGKQDSDTCNFLNYSNNLPLAFSVLYVTRIKSYNYSNLKNMSGNKRSRTKTVNWPTIETALLLEGIEKVRIMWLLFQAFR